MARNGAGIYLLGGFEEGNGGGEVREGPKKFKLGAQT